MPRRRVPSRRFDLESLESRLTPSKSSLLPPGLAFSSSADERGHPFTPSFQAWNASSQTQSWSLQTQTWSMQGLGNMFRQVLVVDLAVRITFLRLDFNINSSLLQFSAQVSNLKTKVDADARSDKGNESRGNKDTQPDSDSRDTTPSASPAARQNLLSVVPTDTAVQTNDNTQTANPAQANATNVNVARQTVTAATDRNALLFTAPGARNLLLPQDRLDTAILVPLANPVQLAQPEQLPIATGFAAAPPRPQLTLPLNGGSNAQPLAPEKEEAIEEPLLPLNLEAADPVVPLLPGLLDQFLEDMPAGSSVRDWIFTASPSNPFWAYALVAAAGSVGASWLTTRRKEKRKGEPFTSDEDDALTDGYPS